MTRYLTLSKINYNYKGVLSLEQIQKGEVVLKKLLEAQRMIEQSPSMRATIDQLSREFYTLIPHRHSAAVNIDSTELFQEKFELLQLMKDMLQVDIKLQR